MWEYGKTHLVWTVPLALALNLVTRPIQTQRQQNRTRLLVAIAVISTIPWDSYLIQRGIWSYPPEAVFGWTLWKIPLEEVFFFVIQTYITSSLYSVLSRPVVHAALLRKPHSVDRLLQWLGTGLLTSAIVWAFVKLYQGGECTYLALIAAWACPFLLMLWALSWIHIVSLPFYATILPIALSTAYFWLVDTVALKRGTWVIEKGTKLELFLWKDLDLEEAVFFLLTNVLIVFGNVTCDFVWAIHDAWPEQYGRRSPGAIPPLSSLVRSLAVPYSPAMLNRLEELQKALRILKDKSKSFYTASMLFEGRMRLDLLSLYAVCREADDLVDEATDRDQIEKRLSFLRQQLLFENAQTPTAFPLLSGLRLPARPFEELIAGFEMDSDFAIGRLPIQTRNHLSMYAERVASSVAEMCVLLAWQHYGSQGISKEQQGHIVASARSMGRALQYVNIARDVPEDLRNGRIYLPGEPLCEATPTNCARFTPDRVRLLDRADELAALSADAIKLLPRETQGAMRAACAVYLDIGQRVRTLLDEGAVTERARCSKLRRLGIAWKACSKI